MRRALIAGEPPWDGVDAVFVSHYHDDHFSPIEMVKFLRARRGVRLYAPEQAVAALRDMTGIRDKVLFGRITAIALDHGDAPRQFELPGLLIEAVRIPHTGWPASQADVENIAWRVTLNEATTVVHLGDADTADLHFERDEVYWASRQPHMAFPPYWFFLSESGLSVLAERLRPTHAVGIHVPVSVPEDAVEREPGLRGVDLFTRPGETREIPRRQ
jgi:L-ascorbate metabolism protein UlaG (beta-lactamase superfamily)